MYLPVEERRHFVLFVTRKRQTDHKIKTHQARQAPSIIEAQFPSSQDQNTTHACDNLGLNLPL